MLPKFLAGHIEAWQPEICFYNADSGMIGSARRAIPTGNVDAYSLLASLGGRRLTARGPYIHYTEDACILFKSFLNTYSILTLYERDYRFYFIQVVNVLQWLPK